MDKKTIMTYFGIHTTIILAIFSIMFNMISRQQGRLDAYQSDSYKSNIEIKSDISALKTDMANVKDGINDIKQTLNGYDIKVK